MPAYKRVRSVSYHRRPLMDAESRLLADAAVSYSERVSPIVATCTDV